MRKLLFSVLLLVAMAVPAQAKPAENIAMAIILGPVQLFTVNNVAPLSFTFETYSDFGAVHDIGSVDYDLVSNTGWEVKAVILDTSVDGQTADNWDDAQWTLSVNGVGLNESGSTVIDTSPEPVNRSHSFWQVLLAIPWPVGPSSPDCVISLTATTL